MTSSLGSVTFRFIYDFIVSIFPFLKENDFKNVLKNKESFLEIFRLIYPSESYVHNAKNPSKYEPYFLSKDFMDGLRFETSILSHYTPKSKKTKNSLYHIKMFITTIDNKITDDSTIYIGSHNFTK